MVKTGRDRSTRRETCLSAVVSPCNPILTGLWQAQASGFRGRRLSEQLQSPQVDQSVSLSKLTSALFKTLALRQHIPLPLSFAVKRLLVSESYAALSLGHCHCQVPLSVLYSASNSKELDTFHFYM
jgi:hypothetical protein